MNKPHISIKADKKTTSLDRYAGEWVAFAGGKVVAHEGNLKRLMEKVNKRKRAKKKPSVLLVPKKREENHII